MIKQTFLQRLETFGYYSLPRPHEHSPGYSGLLVVLRKLPDGHEPELLQLRLHEWDGKTPLKNFHGDTGDPSSGTVCPGRIIIRSRQEREATFYTFGGTLESEALAGETVYSVRSTAPVLELLPGKETLADLLADETEVLFARAEAALQITSQRLLDLLVAAGTEAVYLSVIYSLLQEHESSATTRYHAEFLNLLEHERSWYKKTGRWPLISTDLNALLQKSAERLKHF